MQEHAQYYKRFRITRNKTLYMNISVYLEALLVYNYLFKLYQEN